MYKIILICTALVFNLLFLPNAHGQEGDTRDESTAPAVASAVPAIPLTDLLGRSVDLGGYLGQVPMVLIFWSIRCDSCVRGMQFLQKLEDRYREVKLAVMAVNEDSGDPIPRIRRFTDRFEKYSGKISYPLLYDESSRLLDSLGISSLPTLVLVDRNGKTAGYFQGFNPEDEIVLSGRVEALVREEEIPEHTTPGAEERSEYFTVTGEAALCGFFDSSGWRKSFSGNENLSLEMELTRDIARRSATRHALKEALNTLGIKIYSFEPLEGCISPNGIDLGRDPFDTNDPTSNLLGTINYSDFFETIKEQEMLIDRTYYVTRQVRVYVDNLRNELGSMGYLFDPIRITFTYVNMGPLEQKDFLSHLLSNSKFVGRFEAPVLTSRSTSQVFEVFTSSQGLADEILGIDFGKLQVFVEEVTPTSLELEVWK